MKVRCKALISGFDAQRDKRMNHDEFDTTLEDTEEARFIVCCENMLKYVDRPGPGDVLQDVFLQPELLPADEGYLTELTRLAETLKEMKTEPDTTTAAD